MDTDAEALWTSAWHERLLDWLYPVQCHRCETPLTFTERRHLCAACAALIRYLPPGTACPQCAAPFGPHTRPTAPCPACQPHRQRYSAAVALARYDSPLRELVQHLKFAGARDLARPLGSALAKRVRAAPWAPDLEAVVPVPLHPARERERGYNQAHLLAQSMARALGLPLRAQALVRRRATPPQVALGREERLRNLENAFRTPRRDLGLRYCLLVDDVMSTGTTLSECAQALRAGGLDRVYVAVVARA